MYAAAIGGVDGRAPLLKPETLAECAKPHTPGVDLVTAEADRFALGFTRQPAVGPEAFGHSGAAGAQGFMGPGHGNRLRVHTPPFRLPGRSGTGERAPDGGGAGGGAGAVTQAWPVSKRLILPPGVTSKRHAVRISPQVSLR